MHGNVGTLNTTLIFSVYFKKLRDFLLCLHQTGLILDPFLSQPCHAVILYFSDSQAAKTEKSFLRTCTLCVSDCIIKITV
jgi:hypothetical protein